MVKSIDRSLVWKNLALALVIATSTPADADPCDETPYEKLLPPACQRNAPKPKGHGQWHAHHICYGICWMMRAQDPMISKQELAFFLNNAESDFSYTINQILAAAPEGSTPVSVNRFLAPVYYFRGEVYVRQEKAKKAMTDLMQAIRLNPKMDKPYVSLYDFYIKHGLRADAEKILQDGLKEIPDSKALLRRKSGKNK